MQFKRLLVILTLLPALLLLSACTLQPLQAPSERMDEGTIDMANPAAVFCEEEGYEYEIRTADDGSQSGVCIFDDGSECDGWAYYRGECDPGRN